MSLEPVETFTGDTPRLRERRELDPFEDPPTVPLLDAEARVREWFEELVQRPVRGCHVLDATFGIGKTRNACRVLAHGYRFDTVPTFRGRGGTPRRLRACVLTDTREQAQVIAGTLHEEGLTEDGFALLVGGTPRTAPVTPRPTPWGLTDTRPPPNSVGRARMRTSANTSPNGTSPTRPTSL